MKRATTATVCSNDAAAPHDRARSSADVNRWVARIDAELRSEEDPVEIQSDVVTVAIEFGRGTIDLATQPLQAGDSLRLDQLADEPLDVVVDGRPIARGELVIIDGQLGVRIVELLLLVAAWLMLGTSPSLADERSREQPVSKSIDEQPDAFQSPLGTVRGLRSIAESENSFDVLPNSDATPLPRRSEAAHDANRVHGSSGTGWSATVLPLLLVVGLIVAAAKWLKLRSPSASRGLPSEVFELLGRKAIDPRTSVVLARCGSRLLVLSQSPHGLRTLAEITDPVEIDCLAGLCHSTKCDQTLVETFRALLHKPTNSKSPTSTTENPTRMNSLDERLATRLMSARSVAPVSLSEVRP